jgi:porin
MKQLIAIATYCLMTFAATPLFAEEAEKPAGEADSKAGVAEKLPNYAEERLTGDWGGARSAAAKAGFTWEGAIKVDTLHNSGAQRQGTRSVSHTDLKLGMDLEKIVGWSGGSAMINVISDSGWGPNARKVGGLMGVTNIEVGAPTTTRLFQAWLQQTFLDDQLAVLAGLYPIDSEFFAVDSAGVFLGPQYGTPADLALTRGPSIFNNSAFGIRAKWQSPSKTLYAMGAVLDGIPNDPRHPKRTVIRFDKGDGTFSIGEVGWLAEADNDKYQGHAKLAAGLWGYSAKVNDLVDLDSAGNPRQRHSRGGYVLGEKTLLRLGDDQGRFLSGFARYTWGDGDSSAVENSLNLGVHLKGPFAARPDDILGLAWTRAGISDKWRAAELAKNGNATKGSEEALELTYRYVLMPYFIIQPNFQHIRNPGGISGTPSAKLIGFRVEVAL